MLYRKIKCYIEKSKCCIEKKCYIEKMHFFYITFSCRGREIPFFLYNIFFFLHNIFGVFYITFIFLYIEKKEKITLIQCSFSPGFWGVNLGFRGENTPQMKFTPQIISPLKNLGSGSKRGIYPPNEDKSRYGRENFPPKSCTPQTKMIGRTLCGQLSENADSKRNR